MSDRVSPRVMRRFRDGDPGAVRDLYQQYGRAVFTVAYRALGDRDLAEEAVQQTFLKAWRASSGFDPHRDPAAAAREFQRVIAQTYDLGD